MVISNDEEAAPESAASPGDAAEVTGATAEDSDIEAGADHGAEPGNGPAAGAEPAASEDSAAGTEDPSGGSVSGTEAESGEPSDGAPVDAEADEQVRLAEEVLLYKDRLVRLAAEFDNYKKRTGREFTTLVKNAGESLITELLPILDNIERALQAPQTSDETRSFAQGFEMIRQQFLEKLERAGMKEIAAEGTPFDPTRHEAVMAVENEEHPADTVINVVEKGYTLNEKVLRAAKVIVTRAPAKAPDQVEQSEQAKQAGQTGLAEQSDQTDQAETENKAETANQDGNQPSESSGR